MNIQITKGKQGFTPVSITLTADSQEELDGLGSFFNTVPISAALRTAGFDSVPAYNGLQKAGAVIHRLVSKLDKQITDEVLRIYGTAKPASSSFYGDRKLNWSGC